MFGNVSNLSNLSNILGFPKISRANFQTFPNTLTCFKKFGMFGNVWKVWKVWKVWIRIQTFQTFSVSLNLLGHAAAGGPQKMCENVWKCLKRSEKVWILPKCWTNSAQIMPKLCPIFCPNSAQILPKLCPNHFGGKILFASPSCRWVTSRPSMLHYKASLGRKFKKTKKAFFPQSPPGPPSCRGPQKCLNSARINIPLYYTILYRHYSLYYTL